MSIADIVRQFGVAPRRIRLIGKRHNAHWRVAGPQGDFILRRYGWDAGADSVRWEHQALNIAAQSGLPVPVPLGDPFEAEGGLYDLFALLPGRPRKTQSDEDYRQDGRTTAHINSKLRGATQPQRPGRIAAADAATGPSGDAARRARLLEPLRAGDPALADLLETQAELVVAQLTALGARQFPRALIHGDLIGANLLYSGGVLTGIIDFEASRIDARAADVAQTRRGYHDPVVDGYCSTTPLGSEEIEALPALWKADILHNVWRYLAHFGANFRREDFAWPEQQFRKTVPYKK
ncbi:MAG TPA: phosphotransferase [Rhizomicrobium sp.]